MPTTIRLSASDVRQLRRTAESIARRYNGTRRFAIEIGERSSLNTGRTAMNIRSISNDPDWEDTDLFTTHEWRRIRDRHELANGKALFDLYIYERPGIGEVGDLVCNVQAEIDAQGLAAIHADAEKNVWERPARQELRE
ncbi:hypothetical protein KRZ98_16835 [Sphingobium sp. AS12]|uniref:hypothetical protein n=1 Tax=Sphingobium sp. AS12 TaxID=2849495 RepID=UPI001C31234F|nr:hypothetical protein [Sphingobium sp. AS12]MBV2149912.1 hypothetical protein [Sphingobium sp. AS12]